MDESCHALIKKGRVHNRAMSPKGDCTHSHKSAMSHMQPIVDKVAQNL